MFDKLFKEPALSRQREAPLTEERSTFLNRLTEDGFAHETLVRIARELLVISQELNLVHSEIVTPEEIGAASERWAQKQKSRNRARSGLWSRIFFQQIATDWLRFLGRLYIQELEPKPFASLVDCFLASLQERGLSETTIGNYQWYTELFLLWFSTRQRSFADVSAEDLDNFFTEQGMRWCRTSIATSATALRAFFQHMEAQQGCRTGIASAIETPRLFRDETLPTGPTWEELQRIIPPRSSQHQYDIRNRAIFLLFAVYGLRSGEVARLQLEDFDWTLEQFTIIRTKQDCSQIYPLSHEVGNAIIRYLQEVRPHSDYREVFLSLKAPFRPLSTSGLYSLTRIRFDHLGVQTPHRGPHALRHACACHLLSEGFSLDTIRNHLGHQNQNSTRHYARVDLAGLREVARFDLGGLL